MKLAQIRLNPSNITINIKKFEEGNRNLNFATSRGSYAKSPVEKLNAHHYFKDRLRSARNSNTEFQPSRTLGMNSLNHTSPRPIKSNMIVHSPRNAGQAAAYQDDSLP
jgi:hypothetical protein